MKVEILGLRIDQVNSESALARAEELLSGRGHYIVTPNPEFTMYAQKDSTFKNIINRADLAVPDGIGLIWASRVLGKALPGRVAGADLAEALVKRASETDKNVFFLGGRAEVGIRASRALQEKYPSLKVAGTWDGQADEEYDRETRSKIGKKRVDLLLVAFGHPKQEYWINRNLDKLNVGVAMGIGGAFDFWSGQVKRAPGWVRKIGLEWLFRLINQPWRLKRQLQLLTFVALVLREKYF